MTITTETLTSKQREYLAWAVYTCGQAFEHAYMRTNGNVCSVCERDHQQICCGDIAEREDGSLVHEDASCSGCCGPHSRRTNSGVGYYTRMDCDC